MAQQKEGFLPPNHPLLSQIAEPIPVELIPSGEIQDLVEGMLMAGYGQQKEREKPLLVGLAGPQIGISKCIILVDTMADGKGRIGKLEVFLNPEITWASPEESEWYEGCYSTDRVCGIVSRPVKVKVKAYTREGKLVENEYSDYIARIFQHEIDHLNGKEFVTHITNDENLHWVEDEQMPEYRNNEAWRTWPHKCPRSKWVEIKGVTA